MFYSATVLSHTGPHYLAWLEIFRLTNKKARNETPWDAGDPSRKIGINIPIPEPLMMQLDYLIENRVIRSKSSFIRDTVSKAATEKIERLWMVREAVRRMEAEGKTTRRTR